MSKPGQEPEPVRKPRIDPSTRRIIITTVAVALIAVLGWLIQTYT